MPDATALCDISLYLYARYVSQCQLLIGSRCEKHRQQVGCQVPLPIRCRPCFTAPKFRCRRARPIGSKSLIYNIF